MTAALNDVSIIIVTYQGDDLTKNCLDSLAATCGTGPQVVVVDNSPSAATRQLVSGYENAVYVPSEGNLRLIHAKNKVLCNWSVHRKPKGKVKNLTSGRYG